MAVDVAAAVSRWVQGASGGQQRYVDGIQSTTKDPTALAVAAQGKLSNNWNDAVNSGRWARNLARAGKAKWQTNAVNKASNWSTGIQAGQSAYEAAMQVWGPIISQASAQIATMPNATIEDSAARSRAFMIALRNAKLAR